MNRFNIFYFLVFILLFTSTCSSIKTVNKSSCAQEGKVIDLAGLDGCGLLIELNNGDRLLPLSLPENAVAIQAGQNITFDYEVVPDVMTICMVESASVNITCLAQEKEVACVDTKTPMQVEWMKKITHQQQSLQIIKYKYQTEEWAYLFVGKKRYLYDCHGKLICSSSPDNNCLSHVQNPLNAIIIWVGEFRGD